MLTKAVRFLLIFLAVTAGAVGRAETSTADEIKRALADPKGWYARVLGSRWRPGLADIVPVLEACSACRRQLKVVKDKGLLSEIAESGPGMIAHLEAFYPGGVYATLGRDTVAIADVLESYYLSAGVTGRVSRLGASTDTFDAFARNPKLTLEFLRANGLDLKLARDGRRPFAIIDRTSYSPNSQSTRLMRAVFDGRSFSQRLRLARHVGVVSTSSGFSIQGDSAGVGQFKALIDDEANWVHGWDPGGELPPHLKGHGMRRLTDSDYVWHETFIDRLVQTQSGRWTAMHAGLEHKADRESTLAFMWGVYRLVRSTRFHARVLAEAGKLGVDLAARLNMEISAMDPEDGGARRVSWSRLIEADLIERIPDPVGELGPVFLEKINALVEDRWERWADLNEDLSAERIRTRLGEFRRWRRDLAAFRARVTVNTALGLYLADLVFELGERRKFNADDYFSINAREMHQWFESNLDELNQAGVNERADLLRVIEAALSTKRIDATDARRLTLFALSTIAVTDGAARKALSGAIEDSPRVKQILIAHAQVYLTSHRFNEGQAAQVYEFLVKRRVLPRSDCAVKLRVQAG